VYVICACVPSSVSFVLRPPSCFALHPPDVAVPAAPPSSFLVCRMDTSSSKEQHAALEEFVEGPHEHWSHSKGVYYMGW
jgi:hypothetical protein